MLQMTFEGRRSEASEDAVNRIKDKAALSGWEMATAEVGNLKLKLEQTLQQKDTAEKKMARMEVALKECVKELRWAREEQSERINQAVAERLKEEAKKARVDPDHGIREMATQLRMELTEAVTEMDAMAVVLEDRALIIQDLEQQTAALTRKLQEAQARGGVILRDEDTPTQGDSSDSSGSSEMSCSGNGGSTLGQQNARKASLRARTGLPGDVADGKSLKMLREGLSPPCDGVLLKLGADAERRREEGSAVDLEVLQLRQQVESLEGELAGMQEKLSFYQSTAARLEKKGKASEVVTVSGSRRERATSDDLREAYDSDSSSTRSDSSVHEHEAAVKGGLAEADKQSSRQAGKLASAYEALDPIKAELERSIEGRRVTLCIEPSSSAADLSSQLLRANRKISELETSLVLSRQETADLDAELTSMEEVVTQLDPDLHEKEALQRELAAADDRNAELLDRLAELESDLASSQARGDAPAWGSDQPLREGVNGAAELEGAEVAGKAAALEDACGKALPMVDGGIAELSRQLASWQQEKGPRLAAELQCERKRSRELLEQLRHKQSLEAEVVEARARIREMGRKLLEWQQESADLRDELAWAMECVTNLAPDGADKGVATSLASGLVEAETWVEDLGGELERSKGEKKVLEAELAMTRGLLADVAVQLADSGKRVEALREQLAAVTRGLTKGVVDGSGAIVGPGGASWVAELEGNLQENIDCLVPGAEQQDGGSPTTGKKACATPGSALHKSGNQRAILESTGRLKGVEDAAACQAKDTDPSLGTPSRPSIESRATGARSDQALSSRALQLHATSAKHQEASSNGFESASRRGAPAARSHSLGPLSAATPPAAPLAPQQLEFDAAATKEQLPSATWAADRGRRPVAWSTAEDAAALGGSGSAAPQGRRRSLSLGPWEVHAPIGLSPGETPGDAAGAWGVTPVGKGQPEAVDSVGPPILGIRARAPLQSFDVACQLSGAASPLGTPSPQRTPESTLQHSSSQGGGLRESVAKLPAGWLLSPGFGKKTPAGYEIHGSRSEGGGGVSLASFLAKAKQNNSEPCGLWAPRGSHPC